jgi:hypothetical protein
MSDKVEFGFPEEMDDCARRNALFFERWPNLKMAVDAAFQHGHEGTGVIDRVVYMLGCVCQEDFLEMLLLIGNGYGIAALKLLRGMYERAVTMTYLSENPEEVDTFLNYHAVAQYKLLSAIKREYTPGTVTDTAWAEAEAEYQRVKDDYLVTACKQCGTQRVNFQWSKLDFVSMAQKAGSLGRLIVPAYYYSLGQTHSTVASMLSRVERAAHGGLGFNPDAQRDEADQALQFGHNILLRVIELQWKHFHMGDELWRLRTICHQDFLDIWKSDSWAEKN